MIKETYSERINDIKNNTNNIAYAIAMSITNGDEKRARELIPDIENTLNNTEHFVIGINRPITQYRREVDRLCDELDNITGVDIKSRIKFDLENPYVKITGVATNKLKPEKRELSEPEILYGKDLGIYRRIHIGYSEFKRIYDEGGVDKVNELRKAALKLTDKLMFFEFKNEFSAFKELFQFKKMGKAFDKLAKEFKLKTLDDLLDLRSEAMSFLVDEKDLNPILLESILKQREKFKKRMGNDYKINPKTLNKLINSIDEIYSYSAYKNLFEETNIGEIFKNRKIPLNKDTIKFAYSFLANGMNKNIHACCFNKKMNFGKGDKKCCMYLPHVINSNNDSQNNTILHESVHALEKEKKGATRFSIMCNNVNEAITEYFAMEGCKYLSSDILTHDDHSDDKLVFSYRSMIPLVEKLKASPYWDLFLDAKFNGNTDVLEKTIGKSAISTIEYYFSDALIIDNDNKELQERWAQELEFFLDSTLTLKDIKEIKN